MSLDSTVSEIEATVKKKRPEYIIAILVLLVTTLCGVIYWGYLHGLLVRTGEAVPRRVLGAAIALLSVLSLSFFLLTLRYYRKLKKSQAENSALQKRLSPIEMQLQTTSDSLTKAEQENRQLKEQLERLQDERNKLQDHIDNPPKLLKFGVYWDKSLNPYCPVHADIPLSRWIPLTRAPGYMCPIGGHMVTLENDGRVFRSPKDAKRLVEKLLNPESASSKPKSLESLSIFKANLPSGDIGRRLVAEYHSLLMAASSEIGQSMNEYFISPRDLKSSSGIQRFNEFDELIEQLPATSEPYCDRSLFTYKLDSAIAHLNGLA